MRDKRLLGRSTILKSLNCKADAMKRLCRAIAPLIAGGALGFVVSACASTARQVSPAVDRGTFIARLGPDTMFVERFELSPRRMYVESVVRAPTVIFRTIDGVLNSDGTLSWMKIATFDPSNPRAREARDSATIAFSPDSTIYSMGIGATKQHLRLAGRGDLVISLPGSYWFPNYVLLAAHAPRVVGDSMLGALTARHGTDPLVVKRVAPDTVTVWSQLAGTMRIILGPDGRITGLDGTGSSLGYIATRVDWIDIDSVSRVFAERERVTGTVGTLSARDTVHATIGDARLTVDYGRPSKRGRRIFGEVVPWNRVWRTGANLATHLTTSRALQFGGTILPAGAYTLHTIPAPESWTLLVSRQTGQWGTSALDPAMVVARIPMRVSRSTDVVEMFTIAIDENGAGGVLRLAWDETIAEANFVLR